MAITTIVPSRTKQVTSFVNNGFTTDTVGGTRFPLQQGVPYQNMYMFKVIPASESNTCVVNAKSWPGSSSTSYTLNTIDTLNGTEVISSYETFSGQTGILLDCERLPYISFSEEVLQDVTITATGYDYRGVPITSQNTCAEGETDVYINTCFSFITGIFTDVTPGDDSILLSVGNSSFIGLPYLCNDQQYIISAQYGLDDISANFDVGLNWRENPPLSAVPSVVSTRGVFSLGTTADGETMMTVFYYVYGSDSELNGQIENRLESSLELIPVKQDSDGDYVWQYLTKYDVVGMQYPGDYDEAVIYDALITA